jgi:hypothetical protein
MLLRQKVTATSDAMGNISFTFPTVPVNQAWTGSFAIPTAPASAAFVLNLETGEHGGWGGPTPWGPLRLSPSEVATVTGGGLQPNTGYTAVLLGDQQPSGVLANVPYPAPQTGNPPTIPPADVLSTQQTLTVTGTAQTLTIASVPSAYETILVSVAPSTGSSSATYAVQVQNLTTGVYSAWQSILASTDANDAPLTGPLYFPVSFRVNDGLRLHFVTLDGSSTPTDISIEGLGGPIQPSPLRPDGRLLPQGSLSQPVAANHSTPIPTLIAAPTLGRILLSAAQVGFGNVALPTNPNQILINAVVGGQTIAVAWAFIQSNGIWGSPNAPIPPEGLLCDMGSAVTVLSTPDTVSELFAQAVYDIVL